MSNSKQDGIVVGPVRIAYPHLSEPNEDDNGKNWFDGTFLMPHDDQLNEKARAAAKTSLDALRAEIRRVAIEKFGKDKLPRAIEKEDLALQSGYPLADQDEKAGTPVGVGFESGHVYFSAKSKMRVGVMQGNRTMPGYGDVIEPEDIADTVFAGCWVSALIKPYAYTKAEKGQKGPKKDGIGLGLQAVRFLKTDERLGGGGVDATDVDWGDDDADDLGLDDDGLI